MDSRSSTSAHGAVPQTSTKGLIDAKLEALEHSYGLTDASPPQPRGEPQLIPSGFRVSPPATPPMTPTPVLPLPEEVLPPPLPSVRCVTKRNN